MLKWILRRTAPELADRWVHIRPSGTEPNRAVIAEAPSEPRPELIWKGRAPLDSSAG